MDPSHRWQSSSFLQRMGPGLLSVLWPRLASIQGLHLHQSDTKPHGPPARISSRESNCDRFVLPFKEMQGLLGEPFASHLVFLSFSLSLNTTLLRHSL